MRCISTILLQLFNNHHSGWGKPLLLIFEMDMVGERKHGVGGESSMYSCIECDVNFQNFATFAHHKKNHETKIYKCQKCPYSCTRKYNLQRHVKSVHNPEKIKCEHCESSFGGEDDLAEHKLRKHTLIKCEECEFSTYKNHEFNNHMLGVHPHDNYNEEIVVIRWGTFIKRTFKVDGVKSPLDVLKEYEEKIKKILKRLLEEEPIKTYITMKIRMNRMKNGEVEEMDKVFNGGRMPINGRWGYLYEELWGNIMEDFEAYNENGGGWVFERVVDLQLYTGKYRYR